MIRRHPRRAAGLAALVVLAVMVVLLQWRIAPLSETRFLPQASWSYTPEALQQFGTLLLQSGEGPLYRNILRLDLLFMALWGYWVVRALPGRRALGLAIAGAVLFFDLGENVLLQQDLDWAMGRILDPGMGWTLYPPHDGGLSALAFTRTKLVLYPLVTLALLWRDWRRRTLAQ